MTSWFIYTPKSLSEVTALVDEYHDLFQRFFESTSREDEIGEVRLEGHIPSAAEIREHYEVERREVPDEEILDRLGECKTVVEIHEPGALSAHPAQVTALRYLLEDFPGGVLDWGDHDLERTEAASESLAAYEDAGSLRHPEEG